MLKAIEIGLLAVILLVFLGLMLTGPARRRSRIESDAARAAANDAEEPGRPENK
mgnify:CR=1 FL=1